MREARTRLGRLIVTLLSVLVLSGPASLAAQETPYTVRGEPPVGDESVMVFLTSHACGPGQRPDVIEAVKVIKRRLAAHADSVDGPFSAVGVSAGRDVEAGIEHLQKYGDERLLYRAGGSDAILAWAESGVSIPE